MATEHLGVGCEGVSSDTSSRASCTDALIIIISGTKAPATAEDMETPNLVSMIVQREARDWMKGKSTAHAPKALTIAETEVELSEGFARLEARKQVLTRANLEGFEIEMVTHFEEEQPTSAMTLIGEDRRMVVKETPISIDYNARRIRRN